MTHPPAREKSFFGHPRGLATLFGTEMWERFSYYGMRSILVLFLSAPAVRGGMGLSETTAVGVYGVYIGSVYLLALAGGWMADRLFGPRKTVLYGAIVIMCGHLSLSAPAAGAFVWLGLVLVALGSGMLKPNIAAMVGDLYPPRDDARRDSGYTIFFLGINIGAFAGIMAVPWLQEGDRWHLAFGAAAAGMAIGLGQYVLRGRHLAGIGEEPEHRLTPRERARFRLTLGIAVPGVALALTLWALSGTFTIDRFTLVLALATAAVPLAYFLFLFNGSHEITPEERTRLRAYVWLFLGAAVFWMIYDQAGGALTLFAQNNTDLDVMGFSVPPGWINNVNSLAIIILAPVFADVFLKAGDRVSAPAKFAVALLLVGLSFVVMSVAAGIASGGVRVSIMWLISVYLIQTIGELFLSPAGLSVTNKLAPRAFENQMMGVWYLAISLGDAVGGQTYRLTAVVPMPAYYLGLALAAVAAGVAMMMSARRLRVLMGDTAARPAEVRA
ncbi:POT family proton-dependent oligopeptide transporter [Thermocatellispora tengchongensis]|uniref:POT family proton-dependent oligopeptide transporter n=1 Tax=Thermocatellispora tengchongensis TaxID=1073253 RepID=A0A840P5B1_9ACTN|nr:oligopeptide:H+ symporter [Thermocatellispora tengchongensis]MBB5134532.1 POT family proton-dependent oligopeptide transporter [Thermocatellispora tengchongensis]